MSRGREQQHENPVSCRAGACRDRGHRCVAAGLLGRIIGRPRPNLNYILRHDAFACDRSPDARRPADADVQRARERGAQVGETVAVAGEKLKESMAEGSLLAKIKSKMALDDVVQARSVDVSVNDDIVTLSGNVRSQAERDRAVSLARETQGVRSVVDHLQVRP